MPGSLERRRGVLADLPRRQAQAGVIGRGRLGQLLHRNLDRLGEAAGMAAGLQRIGAAVQDLARVNRRLRRLVEPLMVGDYEHGRFPFAGSGEHKAISAMNSASVSADMASIATVIARPSARSSGERARSRR